MRPLPCWVFSIFFSITGASSFFPGCWFQWKRRGLRTPEKECNERESKSPCFLCSDDSFTTRKTWRWREEGVVPNMREIQSAGDLVDSLSNAGEKLVVVVFFSPGCGGCRALQPKICRVAEKNPDVLLLQVNYEEYKSMCCTLNVYVLPSFFLYALQGAQGLQLHKRNNKLFLRYLEKFLVIPFYFIGNLNPPLSETPIVLGG